MNVETGEIREFVNSDALQQAIRTGEWIKLDKMPDQRCKKCYGTGSLGKDVETHLYIPCRCVKKKGETDKVLDRIREAICQEAQP